LSDFNVFSVAQFDNNNWGTKSNLGGGTGKSQDFITDAAQARLIAAGRSRALAAFGSSENGQVESEASALVSQLRSKMREQRQHLKKSAIAREKTWTTTNFLSIMASDNVRFDEDKFWVACGFMKVAN
jgi:ATP-dependent protease HslVU (ClpYQ) peptidase subunit